MCWPGHGAIQALKLVCRRLGAATVLAAAAVALHTGCDGDDVTTYLGAHHVAASAGDGGLAGAGSDATTAGHGGSGCGMPAEPGQRYVTLTSNGQPRQYYLSIPASYDPRVSYPVVFGLHARHGTGQEVRDLLGLERVAPADWALWVYPDALLREFPDGWTVVGWLNGPTGEQFGGTDDLDFVRDILADLTARFCVDPARIYATGQGWGGDFSAVIGCYLGDQFRAVVPVAANQPYYLPVDAELDPPCVGSSGAWVMHGKGDVDFPMRFGYEHRDFWLQQNGCQPSQPIALELSGQADDDECESYVCSLAPTRFCSYTAAAEHGIPEAYYAAATVGFFRDLE